MPLKRHMVLSKYFEVFSSRTPMDPLAHRLIATQPSLEIPVLMDTSEAQAHTFVSAAAASFPLFFFF